MVEEIYVLRALQSLILVLGLIIVYFSARSYVKTKSKPMLLLAIGFAFVTAGAVLAGLLFEVLGTDLLSAEIAQTTSAVIGFLFIVYSIVGVKG